MKIGILKLMARTERIRSFSNGRMLILEGAVRLNGVVVPWDESQRGVGVEVEVEPGAVLKVGSRETIITVAHLDET